MFQYKERLRNLIVFYRNKSFLEENSELPINNLWCVMMCVSSLISDVGHWPLKVNFPTSFSDRANMNSAAHSRKQNPAP